MKRIAFAMIIPNEYNYLPIAIYLYIYIHTHIYHEIKIIFTLFSIWISKKNINEHKNEKHENFPWDSIDSFFIHIQLKLNIKHNNFK